MCGSNTFFTIHLFLVIVSFSMIFNYFILKGINNNCKNILIILYIYIYIYILKTKTKTWTPKQYS